METIFELENSNPDDIYFQHGHLSLTNKEYKKLLNRYGEYITIDYMEKVINWPKNSKKKSLYLTICNWVNREEQGIIYISNNSKNDNVEFTKKFISTFKIAMKEIYPEVDITGLFELFDLIDKGFADEFKQIEAK